MEAFPVAETLDFESMLAEVSAALLSAPVDSFHEELESAIERLGSSHTIRTDVRIVAATNRDPEAVADGRWRADLGIERPAT